MFYYDLYGVPTVIQYQQRSNAQLGLVAVLMKHRGRNPAPDFYPYSLYEFPMVFLWFLVASYGFSMAFYCFPMELHGFSIISYCFFLLCSLVFLLVSIVFLLFSMGFLLFSIVLL